MSTIPVSSLVQREETTEALVPESVHGGLNPKVVFREHFSERFLRLTAVESYLTKEFCAE